MSPENSLTDKLNLASGFHLQDVEKEDFVEEILSFYNAADNKGMETLFRAYSDFLLRGSASETEEEVVARAKKNLGFVSYAADLLNEGHSRFEVIEKAKKTKPEERKIGPARQFFYDSIKDYQLVRLSGYKTLYNGALYSKAWIIPNEQKTRVLSFILLRRYTSPTEKEIVSCLQQAVIEANRFEPSELIKIIASGNKVDEPKTLEQTIARNLAEQTRLDLMVGEEKKLNLLASKAKAFFEKTGVPPGQQFLDIRYSLVPDIFIKSNKAAGNIRGLGGYGLALSSPEGKKHSEMGLKWSLEQLLYANALPGRELISLADISINDQKEAGEVIDAIYAALPTPAHFAQIIDASDVIKEGVVLSFIKFLNELSEEETIKTQQLTQQYAANIFGSNGGSSNSGKAN